MEIKHNIIPERLAYTGVLLFAFLYHLFILTLAAYGGNNLYEKGLLVGVLSHAFFAYKLYFLISMTIIVFIFLKIWGLDELIEQIKLKWNHRKRGV